MEMSISTINQNCIAFTNKKLQNATMEIMRLVSKIRNNYFEVSAIIANVDAMELYKEDGFNNVHEWTTRAFNIKKSMSYDLLKIGREYIRAIETEKGRVIGYECNLDAPDTSERFAVTQVIRMLPVGHDKAQELINDKVITPDMSSVAIGKIIRSLKNPEPAEPAEPAEPDYEAMEESYNQDLEISRDDYLRQVFDGISTAELIEELKKRGFSVFDREGRSI